MRTRHTLNNSSGRYAPVLIFMILSANRRGRFRLLAAHLSLRMLESVESTAPSISLTNGSDTPQCPMGLLPVMELMIELSDYNS
jgi:hypothetical protein